MNRFASGWKQSYYGKGDVIAYRLYRDGSGPNDQSPVFGANVKLLIYGNAFWPTYASGDNTNLIATDSMKNFIQRETMNFTGGDLESYCKFLGEKFLNTYPRVEGAQISAEEIPWSGVAGSDVAFAPAGPERAFARLEMSRSTGVVETVEAVSGITGFKLLRLNGSAFAGFVRDQYTTLPDIRNRPLHMWLDLDWTYAHADDSFTDGAITAHVRKRVKELYAGFESGSIQQIIYQMGTALLAELSVIAQVNLEAYNRTWDTIAEHGDAIGVYTDARPPYGCLGLSLRR